MKKTFLNLSLFALFAFLAAGFFSQARAADLQLAPSSPLTGVAFEDRPFQLPVERNFQMALLTVSSGIGRSCGKMEAYGWRMDRSEQDRVNRIFKDTVEKLRGVGYTVSPAMLRNQSKDITVFIADRPSNHFMFLWSAGERGLVLNVCETNAPAPVATSTQALSPSVEVFSLPNETKAPRTMLLLKKKSKGKKAVADKFSPVGKWTGGYTCTHQGYTGAVLNIKKFKGENFNGVFEFYPTERNPSVPEGSYEVYGQYDKETKRILINPGKWLNRPKGYYNTVVVGSFDAPKGNFSGFFQGISGCTSFEARRDGVLKGSFARKVVKKEKKKDKPAVAKKKKSANKAKVVKPKKATVEPVTEVQIKESVTTLDDKKDPGIVVGAPSAAPVPAVSAVPALQPSPAAGLAPVSVPPKKPVVAPASKPEEKPVTVQPFLAPAK